MHRRGVARGASVLFVAVLAACGGRGGKAGSSTSSPSASSSESAPADKVAAYQKALDDLGNSFSTSGPARQPASDAAAITKGQTALRTLRDSWFSFDKKLRDLGLPSSFSDKVNSVLDRNGKVISDLDAFTGARNTSDYNTMLQTLASDVTDFRAKADDLGRALGTSGTKNSSASSSSTGARSSSSASAPTPIADAVAARDRLLALAQQSGAVDVHSEPAILTWPDAFPGMDFAGFGVLATPTKVSGLTILSSKSKNVDYLAIAVIDTSGTCAGGVLEFNSDVSAVTKAIPVDNVSECIASNVSDGLGY